jgi:hypothetical protein
MLWLTNSVIAFLLAGVNFVIAKEVGHIEPSSSLAFSSKPRVPYLVPHLSALWKKQISFHSCSKPASSTRSSLQLLGSTDLINLCEIACASALIFWLHELPLSFNLGFALLMPLA